MGKIIILANQMSQSLWVRDRFLIIHGEYYGSRGVSQSLWVRDRFLMH